MNKYSMDLLRKINISELNRYNDPLIDQVFGWFSNAVEDLLSEVTELKRALQECRNELNLLKGEKGKPEIKANVKNQGNDTKKENETFEQVLNKKWSKSSKKDKIKIDRIEILEMDKGKLPPDAEFKGYEEVAIQEIIIKTDNVLFKREKYYSPLERKVYMAELPEAFKNTEFGPNLKAICATLYFDYRVTENKIVKFLSEFGILISEGTVSNILIKEKADILTQEKSEVYMAGLKSTSYQQTDDTGFRVNGENCYMQIMCNSYYSAYFVNVDKKRETVKDVLSNGTGNTAFCDIILSDDAPQFDKITDIRALCWVHEYRLFKKLTPFLDSHKDLLSTFKGMISTYYKELKKYKENPTEIGKIALYKKFDLLFSTNTGYDQLDERIELTRAKRSQLLTALEHPEVPLHNNLSENGLREIVVKRKISYGTKTDKGSSAWENYMTISATCKKLEVSFFQYIQEIFACQRQMPKLADIIKAKNKAI